MMAGSFHFQSALEEDLDIVLNDSRRYLLKQFDYSITINMHDRNLELLILLFNGYKFVSC